MTINPATDLALSGWWKPAYSDVASWTDTASKSPGTSGGHTLSAAAGQAPHVKTLNGENVASFEGGQMLSSTVLESNLFSASRGEFAIYYYALAADQKAPYGATMADAKGDPYLLGGAGGYSAFALNSTGPKCGIDDGSFKGIQLTGGLDGWHALFG